MLPTALRVCRINLPIAFDNLDIMEKVMRRFYLRGLIEEKMGVETDWKAADFGFRPGRRDRGEGGEVSACATLGRPPRRRQR